MGIWQEYLDAAESGKQVLCHSKFPEKATSPLVRDHQCSSHVDTSWGSITLVEATLSLLKEALANKHSTHFILCSESCIPIRPYAELLRNLEFDGRSMLNATQAGRATHPDKLVRLKDLESIPRSLVHFHAQWLLLSRTDAQALVDNELLSHFKSVFAADECYFGTALAMLGADLRSHINRRCPTWTKWNGGAHPVTFGPVNGATAHNMSASGSYFARKFKPDSNIGSYRLHLGS